MPRDRYKKFPKSSVLPLPRPTMQKLAEICEFDDDVKFVFEVCMICSMKPIFEQISMLTSSAAV